MYDLLIQNGNIIDGTGNKAYFADIATAGGEIVAIGKLDGNAVTKVDAEGMVVSPGFIDFHKAKKFIKKFKLKGINDWRKFKNSKRRPKFIPMHPYLDITDQNFIINELIKIVND